MLCTRIVHGYHPYVGRLEKTLKRIILVWKCEQKHLWLFEFGFEVTYIYTIDR